MTRTNRLTAVILAAAAAAVQLGGMGANAAPMLIKGDLNRDDRVNISDAVILKNYLLGKYGLNENQSIAADINEDGELDSLDLTALQDIIIGSTNRLPSGTWIGDCMGGKRYFSFGDGAGTLIDPTAGITDSFDITANEDIVVLLMKNSGAELSAFITWQNDESFVLKWDSGDTETFRYFCEDSINASELLTGHWVTSQGRTFDINGLSGKLTDKSGYVSRFEYAPSGEDVMFHFGSTENSTGGKLVHTDSMHFAVTWADGTRETFTRQETEVRGGITYVNGILIANKTYGLPSDYNPGKILPDAQSAFNSMQADAKKAGLSLWICSGFRSYTYQNTLYNNYVARDGKAKADTYSARPGHSEHQTGLAMDINNASDSFNNTKEAKWIAENCYKYGFILRYPQGKQDITGYKYESWHVRYLGKALAKEVHDSGLTLEEFLCIDSKYKS
ncbi:D-alanyl-D-alanine carboxypeptidase family protein [Ruminococcus flavefaciens]|uniref:D-alanyl-D-alanine carboxypeptidase family protein n=1 Tax=Ruminococcus flavefaciens TaxID=1265 RepID=UPI00068559DF|nr:D-alanyl-D-alanine carboxypeptidase family protein [Ruminococcus flavefaciens]